MPKGLSSRKETCLSIKKYKNNALQKNLKTRNLKIQGQMVSDKKVENSVNVLVDDNHRPLFLIYQEILNIEGEIKTKLGKRHK